VSGRSNRRWREGLHYKQGEDVSEVEVNALRSLNKAWIEFEGMTMSQIRKLREYYVAHTGDTTLKELEK
jgi:hypothetical protein